MQRSFLLAVLVGVGTTSVSLAGDQDTVFREDLISQSLVSDGCKTNLVDLQRTTMDLRVAEGGKQQHSETASLAIEIHQDCDSPWLYFFGNVLEASPATVHRNDDIVTYHERFEMLGSPLTGPYQWQAYKGEIVATWQLSEPIREKEKTRIEGYPDGQAVQTIDMMTRRPGRVRGVVTLVPVDPQTSLIGAGIALPLDATDDPENALANGLFSLSERQNLIPGKSEK
jgi:hypothetical protein